MAVILLIIARHSLRHHLHQLLLTHYTRSASTHNGEQRGMPGPDGIDIHPLQSCGFLKEVEGYQILGISILRASSMADIIIISTMAITRLGRLNSSARRNSRMAVSALKSIVLNIVITLNFEI